MVNADVSIFFQERVGGAKGPAVAGEKSSWSLKTPG